MWTWLLAGMGCSTAPCTGEACIVAAEAIEDIDEAGAHVLYQAGCEQGVAVSCGRAGRQLEFGYGVPVDHAAAFGLYERECEQGELRGCMAVANMLRSGTAPGGTDLVRSRSLLEAGCAQAHAFSCASLGQLESDEGDLDASMVAMTSACDLGELSACEVAEQLTAIPPRPVADPCDTASEACLIYLSWSSWYGTPAGRTDAMSVLDRLCSADDLPACTALGFLYSQGLGTEATPAKAAGLYERACRGEPSDTMGCFNLALLLRDGRGVAEDRVRSEALMAQTCAAGHLDGCLMEGNARVDRGDVAGAEVRFGDACAGDVLLGCTNLGVSLLGRGDDAQRALTLLERACQGGEPYGCGALGQELADGVNIAQDLPAAAGLLQMACRGGVDHACVRLGAR